MLAYLERPVERDTVVLVPCTPDDTVLIKVVQTGIVSGLVISSRNTEIIFMFESSLICRILKISILEYELSARNRTAYMQPFKKA